MSNLFVESRAYNATVAIGHDFANAPPTELRDGYVLPIQLPLRLITPVYGLIRGLGGLRARHNYEGLPLRNIDAVRFDHAPAPVIVIAPRAASKIVGMTGARYESELRWFTIHHGKATLLRRETAIGFDHTGHAMGLWSDEYGRLSTPGIMTFTSDIDDGADFYFYEPGREDPPPACVIVLRECLFINPSLADTRLINVLQRDPVHLG